MWGVDFCPCGGGNQEGNGRVVETHPAIMGRQSSVDETAIRTSDRDFTAQAIAQDATIMKNVILPDFFHP
jgi:hypothetical protein